MGNFAESHSLPTFAERKKEAMKSLKDRPFQLGTWANVDHIVDQVYCDLVNGSTPSDIILKFSECSYDGQKKSIGLRTAQDYIACARQRLMYDFEMDMKNFRADLYGKLMAVYNDAMKANDRYNALGALDKIMRLTGLAQQAPQTAIQINGGDKDGKVVVNFGFSKDDENVDE